LSCEDGAIPLAHTINLAFNHDDKFAVHTHDTTKLPKLDFVASFPVIFNLYFSPIAKVNNVSFVLLNIDVSPRMTFLYHIRHKLYHYEQRMLLPSGNSRTKKLNT
jgi:hypothetical protein